MPIIALAGAALAGIGSAATAVVGAVGGALAAASAPLIGGMSALELSAAAGATMSVVGAVTHDRGLMTAGMVLGGIGAVGSLASGVIGAASSIIPDSVDITPSAMTGAYSADMGGMSAGAATLDSATGAWTPGAQGFPDMVGAASNEFLPPGATTMGAAPSDAPPVMSGDGSGSLINPTANNDAATSVATKVSTAGTTQQPPAAIPDSVAVSPNQANVPPGFFEKLMNNDYAQYGMIQAAGSLVQGAFNQLTPAQVSLYDAQAANNRAAAALTAKQTQNMSGAMPVASLGAPKSLAPVSGAPQGSGLINANVTGSVTGAPAGAPPTSGLLGTNAYA